MTTAVGHWTKSSHACWQSHRVETELPTPSDFLNHLSHCQQLSKRNHHGLLKGVIPTIVAGSQCWTWSCTRNAWCWVGPIQSVAFRHHLHAQAPRRTRRAASRISAQLSPFCRIAFLVTRANRSVKHGGTPFCRQFASYGKMLASAGTTQSV